MKRKLHGHTFYQCDYTGIVMDAPYCFMPVLTEKGVVRKKGNYCNWDAVASHAMLLQSNGEMSTEDLEFVGKWLLEHWGWRNLHWGPDSYKQLKHFGGDLSAHAYHHECIRLLGEYQTVVVTADQQMHEEMVEAFDGELHLQFRYAVSDDICINEKKTPKRYMQCYHSGAAPGVPLNALATQIMKRNIYGCAQFIAYIEDLSFLKRTRVVELQLAELQKAAGSKRKRVAPALPPVEFATLKGEMQSSLDEVEEKCASAAQTPASLAKAKKMPKVDGKRLAKCKREQLEVEKLVSEAPTSINQLVPPVA